MASSDVCPTEDALKAFLEYLVDPMLPAKPCTRDNAPPSQQQSVAKQVSSIISFVLVQLLCHLMMILKRGWHPFGMGLLPI